MKKNKNLYSITLNPHRSLTKIGFITMMLLLFVFSFTTGIIFMLKGAWPVFGFFGLDVLLVYLFFKLNFKSGENSEKIHLTNKNLIIEKYSSKKLEKKYIFDANWLKIKILNPKSHLSKLKISSRKESLIVGSFLRPEERVEVSTSLKKALKKYNFYYLN